MFIDLLKYSHTLLPDTSMTVLQLQIMVLGALRSTQPKAANLVEKLSLALALPMIAITQLVTMLLSVA